jgi:hypothetical protein
MRFELGGMFGLKEIDGSENSKLSLMLGGKVIARNINAAGHAELLGAIAAGYFDKELTILGQYLKGVDSYQNGVKPSTDPVSRLELSGYYTPNILGGDATFKVSIEKDLNGKGGNIGVGAGIRF